MPGVNLQTVAALLQPGGLSGVTVRIESALAPPMDVQPFAGDSGTATALEQLVKPKITVIGADGSPLYVVAPAGDPPAVPWVGLGGVALVVAVAAGFYFLGRASR